VDLSSGPPPDIHETAITLDEGMKKILANWLERHQHPVSLALHIVGIPMTLVGIGFGCAAWWRTALVLFVGGYVLQFIGHAVEGNDAGELILFKRMLGLPYTAVAPRDRSN
jgi:hypothetical protein